jgi:hypothetical protein
MKILKKDKEMPEKVKLKFSENIKLVNYQILKYHSKTLSHHLSKLHFLMKKSPLNYLPNSFLIFLSLLNLLKTAKPLFNYFKISWKNQLKHILILLPPFKKLCINSSNLEKTLTPQISKIKESSVTPTIHQWF